MVLDMIKFKRDTAFRKQFFVPDSFAHPAKMDAQLLIWLVENFTKVGETILDPMAGMGTTMLACGLGRNVVLVELEGKFCKMCRDNWEEVKMRPQLGYQMGECQIIQGDARNLEGLVDKIISSPPYADIERRDRSKEDWWDEEREKEHSGGSVKIAKGYQVDKIVTSPPFGEAMSGGGIAKYGHFTDPELAKRAYSAENMNIERQIKRVEEGKAKMQRPDVFTSEGNKAAKGYFEGDYSKNPSNIGNLTYGNIDAVITSPPYGNPRDIDEQTEKNYEDNRLGTGDKQHGRTQFRGRYEVDAVITSPPYEGSLEVSLKRGQSRGARGREQAKRIETDSKTYWEGGISTSVSNIGNLKSQSYLEAMLQVYQQCHKVLKPRGLMILVTKNFIRNKQVVRLDLDTIKLCEQAGFRLLERHYRKLPAQSFWRIIYHQKHPEVELIDKEDILVFKSR